MGRTTLGHLFAKVSRGEPVTSVIVVLCSAVTLLHTESQLRVDSPENGLLVNAGTDLTVTVNTPAVPFQSVSIVGDGPFALITPSSTPPYSFSYRISLGFASGRYRFKAAGLTASGAMVYSDPVEVDIEQQEMPTKLESEWKFLYLTEGERATVVIWGIFPNGSKVDVTRSTLLSYHSDRPSVATVSDEGCISGTNVGKAKITVKYGDKTFVLPVIIK